MRLRRPRVVTIEVKLAQTITNLDVRHLGRFRDEHGGRLRDVVIGTTGSVALHGPDGIAVVSAALLGP